MISVLLLMGGSSSRMNLNENKLFLPLGDKMVFEHSLIKFLDNNFEVICVIQPDNIHYLNKYQDNIKIVNGGKTRQESVYNGLIACSGEYVIIHDAARPFVSRDIIDECINSINEGYNFIVTSVSKDSIYQKSSFKPLDRDNILLAQTPQGGNKMDFINAHLSAKENNQIFTDDISLLMNYSDKYIHIIEGNELNFKITTKLDYIIAKELINND